MKLKEPKLLIATLLLCLSVQAQFKTPVNQSLRSNVQKVVAEFPHQFASLRGEVLATNPQTVEYASLIKVDQAEHCMFTKYTSNGKPVYSWEAVLLHTEDYEEAVQKYKWTFQQVKGINVKYVVDQYTLGGVYEAPAEERKFTTSQLTVTGAPPALKKLRVEVAMQYEFPEWKVAVLVFEKEREDDESGETDDY